jgi:putative ABC transport system permease protein
LFFAISIGKKPILSSISRVLLIACPLSFIIMRRWLMNYAYRIGIGWLTFAVSALIGLAIACLTVGVKTVSAASGNPVESLRYE